VDKQTSLITPRLTAYLHHEFRLDWTGVHGAPHWARVHKNGLKLAGLNGARQDVVELFAFLHDSQRMHDGSDRSHGPRAADSLFKLNGDLFNLDNTGLDMLIYACRHHSDGLVEGDITIRTCWDADRLDLGRVGITPIASKLATAEAREPKMIEWAYRRSIR